MQLRSIDIERFRSIEGCELNNCGGFNVLIGKNNSGKSNVLSAIYAFFACIRNGDVVSLDPPVGQEIDFYQRRMDHPIRITLTFSLSPTERNTIVQDIISEALQMKNAVDSIDPSSQLSITLSITPPPNRFGFVSGIAFVSGSVRRAILNVSGEAAEELHDHLANARQKSTDARALSIAASDTDADDWRMLTGAMTESMNRPPFRSYARRYLPSSEGSAEALQFIEAIFRDSASLDDFKRSLQTQVDKMKSEAVALEEQALTNKIGTFAGEESSVPGYVRKVLKVVSEIKVHQLAERRKMIGKEEADRLLALKVRRGGTEVLKNIQDTVSALLGVQIDAFAGSSSSVRRGETAAEMDVDNFLVEVNGSGIREALRLVLDVEFEQPHILLVEEPEVHLHPALETSMMRLLKNISSDCQVFVTTHSTNFLDTAEMRNVYLVSKDGSTKVELVSLEDAEVRIPKELGIRLSSLFMFDRLIFVEGPSDEAIMREWATTLNINLSQRNVGFVTIGGVRHLSYFATEATLSFLAKRRVKMWSVVDRDERDTTEIISLQERLQGNASVHVLAKREIENYLIKVRPLLDLIAFKLDLTGNKLKDERSALNEDGIRTTVEECAEELKDLAIGKRVARILCKPIYPSIDVLEEGIQDTSVPDRMANELQRMIGQLQKSINKAQSTYEDQAAEVNRIWQSSKLDLVPGDILLDRVCQRYGVRFKKGRDGVHLASLMNISEIEGEIQLLIRAIGDSN